MHILYAFSVIDNYDLEGFHNIIVNVFDVILEYNKMIPLHVIYQIEPKLLLKVYARFQYQVGLPVIINPIFLIPSLESIRG